MKRILAVIALLLLALALAAEATFAVHNPVAMGPVYSVAQVQRWDSRCIECASCPVVPRSPPAVWRRMLVTMPS